MAKSSPQVISAKENTTPSKGDHSSAKSSKKTHETLLPILPLNQIIGLPGDIISFSLNNASLTKIVKKAYQQKSHLFTTCQDQIPEEVSKKFFGIDAEIVEFKQIEKDKAKFKLHFLNRVELISIEKKQKIHFAQTRKIERIHKLPENEKKALQAEIFLLLTNLQGYFPSLSNELIHDLSFDTFDHYISKIAKVLEWEHTVRITYLEGWSIKRRIHLFLETLQHQLEVQKIRKQIRDKTTEKINRLERAAFLNEERKVIEGELKKNQSKHIPSEFQEIDEKIQAFKKPVEVSKILKKEFERLLRIGAHSPHSSVSQDYLEVLLDLPWGKHLDIQKDWKEVEQSLCNSHFGMNKVKEKVLKYLALNQLSQQPTGQILCFVGPPGVGKTSFARAIADALGLPFIKKSLGGVRDESDLRGHRRTYIGSMPGRIIQGIQKAGCINPVFLLDEVDKLGQDYRSNPADALLEILDPDENYQFSDHYIEANFDLSKVFWILTANHEYQIPHVLRDRMEFISFSGYTEREKVHIARDYLIQKHKKLHHLNSFDIHCPENVCQKLIRSYTREAGVRELSRQISNLIQEFALEKMRGKNKRKWNVNAKFLEKALGIPKYQTSPWRKTTWKPGIMAGLAWTPNGGTILKMECSSHKGKGQLKLTGKLGEVMKESAQASFSFIKHHHKRLKIDYDQMIERDFHLHMPAGAVSKEGPSAGLGIALLLYSTLSQTSSRPLWAVTGEISLLGQVLPIGGVKEKLLAAQRENFEGVLLPKSNMKDVQDIQIEELNQLKIYYVETFWQAHQYFFNP